MTTRRFDAILFDFDDTLVPEEQSFSAAFQTVGRIAEEETGVNPVDLEEAVRNHADELWRASDFIDYSRNFGLSSWEALAGPVVSYDAQSEALAAWLPGYRLRAWAKGLADLGVNNAELVTRLSDAFVRLEGGPGTPYADATAVLEQLSKRFRLGLVTDGFPSIQRGKLVRSGLERFFDVVAVSGDPDVGANKPDARPFTKAITGLNATAERTAMVGNNPARDVLGAAQLGMYTVLVRRDGWPSGEVKPDAEITELGELTAVL